MADKGSQEELTLRRMHDGGYLVLHKSFSNMLDDFKFAATGIDEALQYMKDQIGPVSVQNEKVDSYGHTVRSQAGD